MEQIDNFTWYIENQAELLKTYNKKVLAIKDKQVLGAYSDYGKAYDEITKQHELGTFILQLCTEGDDAYTFSHTSLSW